MKLDEVVVFWRSQYQTTSGRWLHPLDEPEFDRSAHTFNLDFPVGPYVGNVVDAPVIILGANAGYDPRVTPEEFADPQAINRFLGRLANPVASDWSGVAPYYDRVNYGAMLTSGKAVLVNACPYRSRKNSEEPENRRLLARLQSTEFMRAWLLEAVLPLARSGERLIVAKRPGLWKLPPNMKHMGGVIFDPAPVSPQITSKPMRAIVQYLGNV